MEFVPLSSLVRAICRGTGLHVCVWDLSGILRQSSLKLDIANQMHSIPFCEAAKSTRKGYALCVKCKALANRKAVSEQKPFSGYCHCGLYEAAYPVVTDGVVRCIVYVGNLCPDQEEAFRRLTRTCRLTGAPLPLMAGEMEHAEREVAPEEAMEIARLIGSFIELLCREAPPAGGAPYHWAVETLVEYLYRHYAHPLTLKDLAAAYYLNEKYVGRLFKSQTGKSFHEFLNDIRMEHAQRLLRDSSKSVTEIAFDCGFESIGYFCRLFKKREGISPIAFRKGGKV